MTTLIDPPPAPEVDDPPARLPAARRPAPVTAAASGVAAVTAAASGVAAVTVGLWVLTGGMADLLAGGTATMLAVGRLTGIVATLGALAGLVLTARPRWLERRVGLDRLVGWHRITGMTAAFGLLGHVVTSLVAAGGGVSAVWRALVDLVSGTDWFVAALVAAVLFAVVSIGSWRRLRHRMSYETWHVIHLTGYLAVALGLPHQLFSGTTFTTSPLARGWWIALYVAVAAIVLHGRVGSIVASVRRPRTEVARIVPEAPGISSVIVTGPGVDQLGARPGHFVALRVLTRDLWWQAHPYSLSAAPQPGALRLTVKALGDGSTALLAVRPGTRVLLEGPYGALSIDRAQGRPVLLVGAGVGVAPMRALLEASSPAQAPIVLARAHTPSDVPLAGEFDQLARERGGTFIPVTGSRATFPGGNPFTAAALRRNIPDLTDRAAFVCGPTALQEAVVRELAAAGVPRDQIHAEHFDW